MAAYRRVYDSRHLQADCEEPRSAPDSGTLRSAIEYGLPLPFTYEQFPHPTTFSLDTPLSGRVGPP